MFIGVSTRNHVTVRNSTRSVQITSACKTSAEIVMREIQRGHHDHTPKWFKRDREMEYHVQLSDEDMRRCVRLERDLALSGQFQDEEG